MLEKIERVLKVGQSRDIDNIVHTGRRQIKQKI
jgi:hypothetical protein